MDLLILNWFVEPFYGIATKAFESLHGTMATEAT